MEQPHPLSSFAVFAKLVILTLTKFVLTANAATIAVELERNTMSSEDEIRGLVEEFIMNLDAKIVSIEQDSESDECWSVKVEVSRKDFSTAQTMWFDNPKEGRYIHLIFEQEEPALVPANVGDLVLVYSSHCGVDEESSIGLVSSKFTDKEGKFFYGCKHLQFNMDNRWINSIYDFEFTAEDYGGYPEGFLKVLTKDEAVRHLQRLLDVAYKKEMEDKAKSYERMSRNIEPLLNSLSSENVPKYQCEKVDLDEAELPYYLSLKR